MSFYGSSQSRLQLTQNTPKSFVFQGRSLNVTLYRKRIVLAYISINTGRL